MLRDATNPENPPFNVILISIDTLRADHLGCYNYPKNTTPNIDAFSEDCVLFTKCVAQSSSTLSSHAAMLTSLIPSHHGASYARSTPLSRRIVTIAEILRKIGYKTISFNDGGQIAPSFGLDQGFDVYKSNRERYRKYFFKTIVNQSVGWLEKKPGKKFFLFLHTYETHGPYTPKKKHLRLFETEYKGELPDRTSKEVIRAVNNGMIRLTEADMSHIVNTYDAEIRSVDESFKHFLDYLKANKLYDNSLIIFTSDHGEEFNEHGVVATHSHTLYNELLLVPLIIKLPESKYSSRRIHKTVRSVDILPTVLDILNIDNVYNLDGLSLLPVIKGKNKKNELFALSERDMKDSLRPECWSIIRGRWKFYDGSLYDLELDPFETINVSDTHMELVALLRRRALRFMQQNRIHSSSEKVKLDQKNIEQLKALGYIR